MAKILSVVLLAGLVLAACAQAGGGKEADARTKIGAETAVNVAGNSDRAESYDKETPSFIRTAEKFTVIGYSDWPIVVGMDGIPSYMEIIAKRKDGSIQEFYFASLKKPDLPYTGSVCDIQYYVTKISGPMGITGLGVNEPHGKFVYSMHCWWNFVKKGYQPASEGTFDMR